MKPYLLVEFKDGSTWKIPVRRIALDRAEAHKEEFGGDVVRSLAEDTEPLFTADPEQVIDWFLGNMEWGDVENAAVCVVQPTPPNYAKWVYTAKVRVE